MTWVQVPGLCNFPYYFSIQVPMQRLRYGLPCTHQIRPATSLSGIRSRVVYWGIPWGQVNRRARGLEKSMNSSKWALIFQACTSQFWGLPPLVCLIIFYSFFNFSFLFLLFAIYLINYFHINNIKTFKNQKRPKKNIIFILIIF